MRETSRSRPKPLSCLTRIVVGPFVEGLKEFDDWVMLVMPDHTTPIKLRTHHTDPVPFIVVSSKELKAKKSVQRRYTEADAAKTRVKINAAFKLLDKYFFRK